MRHKLDLDSAISASFFGLPAVPEEEGKCQQDGDASMDR